MPGHHSAFLYFGSENVLKTLILLCRGKERGKENSQGNFFHSWGEGSSWGGKQPKKTLYKKNSFLLKSLSYFQGTFLKLAWRLLPSDSPRAECYHNCLHLHEEQGQHLKGWVSGCPEAQGCNSSSSVDQEGTFPSGASQSLSAGCLAPFPNHPLCMIPFQGWQFLRFMVGLTNSDFDTSLSRMKGLYS